MKEKALSGNIGSRTASDAAHFAAAEAFVDRARSEHGDAIAELTVFGSTARGDTHGLASDVDMQIILDPCADRETTTGALRDIAYDVTLEYGPIVELHLLSEATFRR